MNEIRFNVTVSTGPATFVLTGADAETFGHWFLRILIDFYTGPSARSMPVPRFTNLQLYPITPR